MLSIVGMMNVDLEQMQGDFQVEFVVQLGTKKYEKCFSLQ